MDVTVLGLGMMGTTLAQLLLRAGHRVHAWNRTPAKAAALASEGAVVAPSAADAVRAASLVVVCVHDYTAADSFLRTPDVAAALDGRVVVQFTTASPKEAREAAAWAAAQGAVLLAGAIQAAPGQMGQPDTPILLSGDGAAFRRVEPVLRVFGGGLVHLGDAPGAAPAMDLATLSYVYGACFGFLHGARVCEAEGFGVDAYGAIVDRIAPSFGAFLKHEGEVIQSGRFEVTQSPMSISVDAVDRLLSTAREAGINDEFPAFGARWMRRAVAAGLQDEEFAALVKLMR